jgi:hypothetical protein
MNVKMLLERLPLLWLQQTQLQQLFRHFLFPLKWIELISVLKGHILSTKYKNIFHINQNKVANIVLNSIIILK